MPTAPRKLHGNRQAATPRRSRKSARQRGYNYQWEKLSAGFVGVYSMCVLCLCRGKVNDGATYRPAARGRSLVVDHIQPHNGERSLLFDQLNLQTLCKTPCHDQAKQRLEGQAADVRREWFEHLRHLITQHGSREHIDAYRDRVPPGVLAELIGPPAAATGAATRGGGAPRGRRRLDPV